MRVGSPAVHIDLHRLPRQRFLLSARDERTAHHRAQSERRDRVEFFVHISSSLPSARPCEFSYSCESDSILAYNYEKINMFSENSPHKHDINISF